MKNTFTILLLAISSLSVAQDKLVFLSSGPKMVNTLPFFKEAKPTAYVVPKTEKIVGNTNVSKGESIIYFDKQNQRTSSEKAFFFRKVKFNQKQMPVGLVEDFYAKSKTPKFSGTYYSYKNEDEPNNNSYQGECTFYSENGEKTINKYVDGKITESKVYLASGKLQKEEVYNSNKTRKSFSETLFDKDGNEIGNILGRYNSTLKVDEYRKLVTDINGVYESITEYEGNCPKLKVTKYKEGGVDYSAYIQDFTCSPNAKEWTFQNATSYEITPNESEKYYQIKSKDASDGFLFTPIISEFSTKKFEISTVFEKPKGENIKEIGMVWQYQNENNYNYFVINLEKKTFEINSIFNGEVGRYMIGIKPQINIVDNKATYTLKLVASSNGKFSYFVDDKEIQGFNKIPTLPAGNLKNWNIGFKFKALKANESINLKKIEIKLL